MPIMLITGLPGSGKSLSAVEVLYREVQKGTGRTIYCVGIDGLADGLAEPLDDPMRWQDLPDGSLIVVDEAQKFFPARRAETLPPVRALSEHRHRGFDFVLITQHPMMIDAYVRKLVSEHVHVVRRWGASVSTKFRWSEVVEDVQSVSMRARASETVWRYPKDLYRLYKSATLHTVKRKLPWQLIALPLIAVAGALATWWAWGLLFGDESTKPKAESVKTPDRPAPRRAAESEKEKRIQYSDELEYAQMHTPRIASLPWSAPVFDDRRPVAEPEVYCVIIEGKPCRCYTEQVTRYHMEDRNCRSIAVDGVYNPYRRRLSDRPSPSEVDKDTGGRVANVPERKPDRGEPIQESSAWLPRVTAQPYRPPTSTAIAPASTAPVSFLPEPAARR